jgi:hypothetical protein
MTNAWISVSTKVPFGTKESLHNFILRHALLDSIHSFISILHDHCFALPVIDTPSLALSYNVTLLTSLRGLYPCVGYKLV